LLEIHFSKGEEKVTFFNPNHHLRRDTVDGKKEMITLFNKEQQDCLDYDAILKVEDDFKLFNEKSLDLYPVFDERMIIREDGFSWMATVEDDGLTVESYQQSYELLNQVI
jgi:hypothetical protein